MAQPYKRSFIPVVDKRFQYKYTAIIIALVVIVSGVLGYLLVTSYWEMNRIMDLAMGAPEIHGKLTDVDQALNVFYIAIAFAAMGGLVIGVSGLLITHRVCGPLFVIQSHLSTLLMGKYPNARPLRSGDEFVSTYETLKKVVESLKKRDEDQAQTLTSAIAAARQMGMPVSHVAPLQGLLDECLARIRSDEADRPSVSV